MYDNTDIESMLPFTDDILDRMSKCRISMNKQNDAQNIKKDIQNVIRNKKTEEMQKEINNLQEKNVLLYNYITTLEQINREIYCIKCDEIIKHPTVAEAEKYFEQTVDVSKDNKEAVPITINN